MSSQLNEREVFLQALEIENHLERDQFVAECCARRPQLLFDVQRLLRKHNARTHCLLDHPLFDTDPRIDGAPRRWQPQDTIGPYTLVEPLGVGGMGEVWSAQQNEPVTRQVALKLIKPGKESPGSVQRFKRELSALSAMNHPHIARVLDAGLTGDQQPYFVMERVEGEQIAQYCCDQQLDIRDRLRIFLQVAQGIQHAHQRAILHRDLKPSNVLVSKIDHQPVVKIIDFGLAKAMTPEHEDDRVTQLGQFLGTLEYMAPEQASFDTIDVDTRSDIYSLGALLYELLCGSHPLDCNHWRTGSITDRIEILQQQVPVRLSVRLAKADPIVGSPTMGPNSLQGELDWVVLKSLDKDPDKRYQTVAEFSNDIQCYLDGRPVQAHPPSHAYRIKKFVARNKGMVSAIVAVLATLLMGLGGTTYGLWRANENAALTKIEAINAESARKTAEERKALAESAQRAAESAAANEKKQRIYSDAIAAFIQHDILDLTSIESQLHSGSWRSLGRDANLSDLLIRASEKIQDRKYLDPTIAPVLQMIIGRSLLSVGKYQRARGSFERSLKQFKTTFGAESKEVGIALYWLADAHRRLEDLESAYDFFHQARELNRRFLGEGHVFTIACSVGIADVHINRDEFDQAIQLTERTIAMAERELGPRCLATFKTKSLLGVAYLKSGQHKAAIEVFQGLLAWPNRGESFDPEVIDIMNHLGLAYQELRQLDKSLLILKQALQEAEKLLEPNHEATITIRNNLGCCYWRQNKLNKSIPIFEELVQVLQDIYPPTSTRVLKAQTNLAANYRTAGRVQEAIGILKKIEGISSHNEFVHRWVLDESKRCYLATEDIDEYCRIADQLIEMDSKKHGNASKPVFKLRSALAEGLLQHERYREAEVEIRSYFELIKRKWPNSWSRYYTEAKLGYALLCQQQYGEAKRLLESGYQGMNLIAERVVDSKGNIKKSYRDALLEAVERLRQHAEETGDFTQVEKWNHRLVELGY